MTNEYIKSSIEASIHINDQPEDIAYGEPRSWPPRLKTLGHIKNYRKEGINEIRE